MGDEDMKWTQENKYHNKRVTVDGITFDSVKEASRYQELQMLARAGEITGLSRQVRIEIVPKTDKHRARTYIADFVYFDKRQNKTVYEDVKGYKKGAAYQLFSLKRDILYALHGIEITEV